MFTYSTRGVTFQPLPLLETKNNMRYLYKLLCFFFRNNVYNTLFHVILAVSLGLQRHVI